MAAMTAPPPTAANNFLLVPHSFPNHRPRSGILLNGYSSSPASSAQNSPRRNSYYLNLPSSALAAGVSRSAPGPSSISSLSSASSTSSSSDDITSASVSTSEGGEKTGSTGRGARKIRFAPLPDPRREVFVTEDGSELHHPTAFADDDHSEACVPALSIPCSSINGAAAASPTSPSPSIGSLGLTFDDGVSVSGQSMSTLTGGSSSYLPLEQYSSRQSDCTISAPSSPKRNTWSRLLRLPKSAKGGSLSKLSTDNLFRSSRESLTAAEEESMKHMMHRRKSTGSETFSAQEMRSALKGGYALTPVVSESGTASTSRMPPSPRTPTYGSRGRGTRLLNGRVYGGARSGIIGNNPFANVKDKEPEFIEWGHGGMGSASASAGLGGGNEWSKLQSSRKLSVGHAEDGHVEEADDGSGMGWVKRRREKREKERKEKEQKEKAEKENGKGREGGGEDEGEIEGGGRGSGETPAITIRSASPLTELVGDSSAEEKLHAQGGVKAGDEQQHHAKPTSPAVPPPKEAEAQAHGEAEPEHVYTAVKLPAVLPKHHHHHHHSHSHNREHHHCDHIQRSSSATSSHVGTPTAEFPELGRTSSNNSVSSAATATAANPFTHHTAGTSTPLGPSPLGASRTTSIEDVLANETMHVDVDAASAVMGSGVEQSPSTASISSTSTTGSSSGGDEDDEDDDGEESGREKDTESEEDDDEEEEDAEQTQKMAMAAGVEKVSRHKD